MKKGTFLDPVANASSIGKFYILGVILNVFRFPSLISKGTLKDFELIYYIFSLILSGVIGYGLIKTKKWALYAVFILMVVGLIRTLFVYLPKGGTLANISVIGVAINLVLFLWFFPARNRFAN